MSEQISLGSELAALHMPDTDENGFVPPRKISPELTWTPAGLTLPVDKILDETSRQGGWGAVLIGPSDLISQG
ncbi:MAG: hypothetical protein VW546_04005, partial [Gammaproteobacteria bacterium]